MQLIKMQNISLNIDETIQELKPKYIQSECSDFCYDSIEKCLKLLFTALKNYQSRPTTARMPNCTMYIRNFKKEPIPFSLLKVRQHFINMSFEHLLIGTFISSRNQDVLFIPKRLYCYMLYDESRSIVRLHDRKSKISGDRKSKISGDSTDNNITINLYNKCKFILDREKLPPKKTAFYCDFDKVFLSFQDLIAYFKTNKRYIIINLFITNELLSGSHANILIYDSHKNIIELFEPNEFQYFNNFHIIEDFYSFFQLLVFKLFTIMVVKQSTKEHWQFLENNFKDEYKDDMEGYCLYWTYLYAELRILNPDKSGDSLHDDFLTCVKNNGYELVEYIRLYITDILLFKREFLVFCKLLELTEISEITPDIISKYLEWKHYGKFGIFHSKYIEYKYPHIFKST